MDNSNNQSKNQTTGISQSFSTDRASQGFSASESASVRNSASVSESASASFSKSQSVGVSESFSVNKGLSQSSSLNKSNSESTGAGYSESIRRQESAAESFSVEGRVGARGAIGSTSSASSQRSESIEESYSSGASVSQSINKGQGSTEGFAVSASFIETSQSAGLAKPGELSNRAGSALKADSISVDDTRLSHGGASVGSSASHSLSNSGEMTGSALKVESIAKDDIRPSHGGSGPGQALEAFQHLYSEGLSRGVAHSSGVGERVEVGSSAEKTIHGAIRFANGESERFAFSAEPEQTSWGMQEKSASGSKSLNVTVMPDGSQAIRVVFEDQLSREYSGQAGKPSVLTKESLERQEMSVTLGADGLVKSELTQAKIERTYDKNGKPTELSTASSSADQGYVGPEQLKAFQQLAGQLSQSQSMADATKSLDKLIEAVADRDFRSNTAQAESQWLHSTSQSHGERVGSGGEKVNNAISADLER